MKSFLSKYDALIDDKGRVVLPSPLKKSMGENLENVIIEKDFFKACLNIYREDAWNEKISTIENQLNDGRGFDPLSEEDNELIIILHENSARASIAANGRINIPDEHMKYAGIAREVVFVGAGKYIRLMDKDKYEEERQARKPLNEILKERIKK